MHRHKTNMKNLLENKNKIQAGNIYPIDYMSYTHKSRGYRHNTRLRNKRIKEFYSILISLVFIILLTAIFVFTIGRAIDIHFDNQDTMLCNSAKVSGNSEYLKKCQPYYETGNIKLIHGEEVK